MASPSGRTRLQVTADRRWAVAALTGIAAVTLAIVWLLERGPGPRSVVIPDLSPPALAGKQAFDQRCAPCHGPDGRGSADAPPLVHRLYHPALHSEVAFTLAVQKGVRAHHWRFGDMPPVPDVSARELSQIIQYGREVQQANGID